MASLDLQEQVRRDDVYVRINKVIDDLQNLGVFPSLTWVYAWDLIKVIYEDYEYESAMELGEYEVVPKGITLKDVWDKFWETADEQGWSLEYGADSIHEQAWDWMRDNDFLVEAPDEQ